MDFIARNLRLTLRRLRAAPTFTAVILATLAIGIGATTGLFSVVDAAILHPVRYANPQQLVAITHSYRSKQMTMESEVSSIGFRDYQAMTTSFSAMAAEFPWTVNESGVGQAERVTVSKVSGGYFSLLGVTPALGRLIGPADDQRGQDRVVVLSYSEWQQSFGGRASAIGREILLDDQPYRVIGVAPKGFTDFFVRSARHWVPLAIDPTDFTPSKYTDEYLSVTARLGPGRSLTQARDEMKRLAARLRAEYPNALGSAWGLSVTPLEQLASGGLRTLLLTLLGAVALVLLIACANVANLLLARASDRAREVAVRQALGAERARLLAQYAIESLVLALLGGALGLGVALVVSKGVGGLLPALPAPGKIFGSRVLVFTAAAAIVTGFAFGLVPALHASGSDIRTLLCDGRQNGLSERRTGATLRAFAVAEVALALVLLTGASLLIQSVARLTAINPGFDPDRLLTFKIALPQAGYPTDASRSAFAHDALASIARVPGVRGVTASNALPFAGNNWSGSFMLEGFAPASMSDAPWGDIRVVDPSYFSTMRIPLREGRPFAASDDAGADRVAVADEIFARKFGQGRSVVGRRISFGRAPGDTARQWWTIVGVVGSSMNRALDGQPRLQVFRPLAQYGQAQLEFALRSGAANPIDLLPGIRSAVARVDRSLPIASVSTMDDLVTASLGQRRVAMIMLGALAVIALALSSLGVYGVISYGVSARLRELGVRMALGASTREILRRVVARGMMLTATGITIGAGIAWPASRLIAPQLFQVNPASPMAMALAAGILAATAMVASLLPAWRATRLDVTTVLRQ